MKVAPVTIWVVAASCSLLLATDAFDPLTKKALATKLLVGGAVAGKVALVGGAVIAKTLLVKKLLKNKKFTGGYKGGVYDKDYTRHAGYPAALYTPSYYAQPAAYYPPVKAAYQPAYQQAYQPAYQPSYPSYSYPSKSYASKGYAQPGYGSLYG
ncbi:serine, glycine and glutamine-rich protein [Hyalella azteca]|uniref:Serine, glycine and glutamine-rich protein n=1 Tax=Hyalella azteca TaxID=294128 RepID=A0A8B7PKW4_HYAAZ|nr:serine, glycine and glutamine-rich protein [Hyalella azteca]